MEETKKEVQEVKEAPKVQEKEYYTKKEVEDLLNSKITATFGDIIKELNKRNEEKKEPKELTIEELIF